MRCHKEPGMHACDNCSYKSNEKSHLRNHLKHTRHTGTFKEYFCTNCRIEFESEAEEKRHKETHNQQGHIFECPICGYKGKTKGIIEQHMTCHDREEEDSEFTCKDCAFQAMNRDQLIVHLGTTHDKHTCIFCNIICNGRNELNIHIEKTHRKKPEIPCTVCNLLFKNLDDLSKHTTIAHTSLSNFKEKQTSYKPCDYFLEDRCTDEECRFNHTKLLQGQQICYKCGKTFTTKRGLLKHIEDTHGN